MKCSDYQSWNDWWVCLAPKELLLLRFGAYARFDRQESQNARPSGTTAETGERVKLSLVAVFVDSKLLLVASESAAAHAPAGIAVRRAVLHFVSPVLNVVTCKVNVLNCGWICTSSTGIRFLEMLEFMECNDHIIFSADDFRVPILFFFRFPARWARGTGAAKNKCDSRFS